jgi:ribosome-associated protein
MAEELSERSTRSGAPADRRGLPTRPAAVTAPTRSDDRAVLELARRVVDLAADKKAADIVLLGVGELTTLADYFVICSGGSERQLAAIADGITEGLKADGVRPIGREGGAGAHWLLLDYGAVIVHIFAPPERDFYQLERLWAEAPTLLRLQ